MFFLNIGNAPIFYFLNISVLNKIHTIKDVMRTMPSIFSIKGSIMANICKTNKPTKHNSIILTKLISFIFILSSYKPYLSYLLLFKLYCGYIFNILFDL